MFVKYRMKKYFDTNTNVNLVLLQINWARTHQAYNTPIQQTYQQYSHHDALIVRQRKARKNNATLKDSVCIHIGLTNKNWGVNCQGQEACENNTYHSWAKPEEPYHQSPQNRQILKDYEQ